ncbi:PIN domain-containing protein [Telmatobacter bradus]|jgi:tetratricopeptide (TPR) repeat protein|uniref:PIN domain-containing protein n=1 Tax=Telmatobacter bradus TaxID=474953 RepID=UPI003B43146E
MNSPLRYPLPKNDDHFEEFCISLLRAHFGLNGIQRYGRRGQRQFGIDILDLTSPPPRFAAQCKADDPQLEFTEKRLRELVEDVFKAPHQIKQYVILSTGKTSTRLQNAIAEINAKHTLSGDFIVEFYGWDLIERLLDNHPQVVQDHLTPVSNAQLATISDKLSILLSRSFATGDSTTDEDPHEKQISLAKSEIERRDFPIAKSRLMALRRDSWDKLTGHQRFIVLANLGNIEAAKGLVAEATKLYFEAIVHDPEHIKARETEGHAYLFSGEYDKTYVLATALRKQHPESWKASMLRIYSAPPSVHLSDLLLEVSAEDLLHSEVLHALASRAHNEKLFSEAEQYARRAIDSSTKEWPAAQLLLGQSLSHPILLGSGSRPVDAFSSVDRVRLADADAIFQSCADAAVTREEYPLAAQALIERATIAERTDKEENARIFVEDAYRYCPNDPQSRSAYATLLQRRNEIERAIPVVEKIVTETNNAAFIKQLSELLLQRNRGDDEIRAIDLQKGLVKSTEALLPHFRYSLICEVLALLFRTGRIAEGDELIKSAPTGSLTPAAEAAINARLRWHSGDEESAKKLLDDAAALLTDQSVDTEVEMIAVTLATLGEYRKSLALWKRIARIGNSLAMRQTLACAQRLGENGDILAICKMIRDSGVDDPYSLQVEADLLQDDDVEGAILVLKDYLSRHPNDLEVRLRLTHIGLEHGRAELIQESTFPLPDPATVSPYIARAVTYFLKCTGRATEALRYGYDVLHRHFDNHDAHRAYMVLFVPLGPPIQLDQPTVVAPGTAIEYAEDAVQGTSWHVIEDEVTPDQKLNEFSASHPVSKVLIGKTVGDRFDLAPSGISRRPAQIKQIVNKYVFRMQRCSDELQIRFPEADELQVMHLPRDKEGQIDSTEFLAKIRRQMEDTNQGLRIYSEQTLPLQFVARMLKTSTFEAVLYLANDQDSIIRCAPSDPAQRLDSLMALQEAEQIVLDLSAIATLVLTEHTDLVTKLNRPIIISQGCSEELDRICGRLWDGSPRAGGRFTWHDDRLIMVDIPEEAVIERERLFSEALQGIRSLAIVEACRELSAMPKNDKEPLIEIFGRYGAQSVLLARKPGRVLWSDDFVQNSVLTSQYGGKGVWSEIVAAHLDGVGRLDHKVAAGFVTRLLAYRYQATGIPPVVFVQAASASNFDAETPPFSFALEPILQMPLDQNLFATIGGIATEIEKEIADEVVRRQLIATVLLKLLNREDGLNLISLIHRAFASAPSARGSEWMRIIHLIMNQLHTDRESQIDPTMDRRTSASLNSDPPKVGRNDPCPCGSGKKYKKCHLR